MEVKKHIIQHFISRVCFVGSVLLVNIVFSRLLGASVSGQLYYTINNYAVFTLIASLSFESGMNYFLSKKEIDDRELVNFSLLWTLVTGCIATLLLVCLRDFFESARVAPVFSFAFITGTLLTTYFSALLFARQQFLFPLLVPAGTNFIIILYCGWLFLNEQGTGYESSITSWYFLSFIVNGILLAVIYYSKYLFSFSFRWPSTETIKKLFGYSSVAFVANLISFFAYRIDYWILKAFIPRAVTENALGNYIQVAKLVQVFLFAPTIVATVVFPLTASGTISGFDRTFKKLAGRVLLLNIVLCAFLVITGKWLFPFLFGNSFVSMYLCFVFSIPAILAITVVRVIASYFAGVNGVKYNLVGGLIALFVVVVLNFLLVPSMGINGAALADSAGYLAFAIFLLVFFKSLNKQSV
ncbi:MAG TPA: polysaccharide biosynthesis C-terminal domain-containing protein [Chitinophagaceae bacterium]|jgi:O-antigen/teichoic acid export membrane protein|nr:polysaccharide biosynthesis C-terminal domain-containing protein [Chitinophagaceae bacterium]